MIKLIKIARTNLCYCQYYTAWLYFIITICSNAKCIKKKAQCGFEPTKMHWAFYRITNAFQMIFDALSNFICYEGSFISIIKFLVSTKERSYMVLS